jgi:chemotaxis protein methyltransferase CheR
MDQHHIERIEIDLLLEAIYLRYGYDFRNYARASINRRVRGFLGKSGCTGITDMIPRLIRDENFFQRLVHEFSITVSEMFRDPLGYKSLRENVVPVLKTFPFVRVWHAGCATGEEAYSLAILLQEEDLYDRATIYATDFNDAALERARDGIYALEDVKKYTRNYQLAGGRTSFSEYYHARYDSIILKKPLKKNITFANHNLVTDGVFSETHVIFCRNVLIYFNQDLQNSVLRLFDESLVRGGFLCLGDKESLLLIDIKDHFKVVDEQRKIYQKVV